jgi:hypothetical protein
MLALALVSTSLCGALAVRSGRQAARLPPSSLREHYPPLEQAVVASRRLKEKERVVARLRAGELGLLEAAAWFRFLNDNPPEYPSAFRARYPGRSDGEKACRQVIAWVKTELYYTVPESQAASEVRRLEAELAALLAEHEHIELPW